MECLIGSPDEVLISIWRSCGQYWSWNNTLFVVGKDENPVNPSAAIRAKSLERIKWAMNRAQAMRATIIAGPFSFCTRCIRTTCTTGRRVCMECKCYMQQANMLRRRILYWQWKQWKPFWMLPVQYHGTINKTGQPGGTSQRESDVDTHHANIEEKSKRCNSYHSACARMCISVRMTGVHPVTDMCIGRKHFLPLPE